MTLTKTEIKSIRAFLTNPESMGFEPACALADKIIVKNGKWTVAKTNKFLPQRFQEQAGNPEDYAKLLKRSIEQQYPVEVKLDPTGDQAWEFVVSFEVIAATAPVELAAVEQMTNPVAGNLFEQIAAAVGGNAATGNFRGSIRVDDPTEDIEVLASSYYEAIKRFCYTATVTYRVRKFGFTITLAAGDRREAAAAA